MKSFDILRYLKKWAIPLIIVCVLAMGYVYKYVSDKQAYTASTSIEYTNAQAAQGISPNGSVIDPTEIYSAAVISEVISELGLRSTIEAIRSQCRVTGVIPEDEKTLKDALLEKGEPYEYIPVEYRVSFSSGSNRSGRYVRQVLDSLLSNYMSLYSDTNIASAPVPNNISNASVERYDYLYCVDLISASLDEIIEYLRIKADNAPLFRASSTGYSFTDLKLLYEYVADRTIPHLYAIILEESLTQNRDALIDGLRSAITQATIEMASLQAQAGEIEALMASYSQKSKEGFEYHFSGSTNRASDYIIKNVEWNASVADEQQDTVYDKLMLEYTEVSEWIERKRADIQGYRRRIATFADCENTAYDEGEGAVLKREIDALVDSMSAQYQILQDTVDEYNEYQSAQNISVLSSITVTEAVNVKMYLLLAFAVFIVVGGGAAIVLGRAGDFVEYMLYVNHKFAIANRNRCDKVIDELSRNVVDDHFVCVALQATNLGELNRLFGRDQADASMKGFVSALKAVVGKRDFAAYNEQGNFLLLLHESSIEKAKSQMEGLDKLSRENAELNHQEPIIFFVGVADSTADTCYDIRELIRIATRRMGEAKEGGAE